MKKCSLFAFFLNNFNESPKKKNLLLAIYSTTIIFANAQTPFTSKITNTSGNLISPHFARICSSTAGTATLQATAGWPFGVGYSAVTDLHVALNHTITIPNGAIADYNSITIDSGGVLQITGGPHWTYIGCKGAFILNGTIIGKGSPAGIYPTHFPDNNGDTTGTDITYTIVQGNGGNGGNSGQAFEMYSYGNHPQYGTVFSGGTQYNGNGGGGGCGNGLQYMGDCGCKTVDGNGGAIGGNATDSTSGYGAGYNGSSASEPTTSIVNIYSQNGNSSANCLTGGGNSWTDASAGGSGGTRGIHGNLIFIQAMSGISGNGFIDVSGNAGGNGGSSGKNGSLQGGCNVEYTASGGGGGGGAGGSGGYVYINYVGTTLPFSHVLVSGGIGGIGGSAGIIGCVTNGQGQSGVNGDNGTAGVYSPNLLTHGYTYQWRKFANPVAGATANTYTATSGGVYDCQIVDIQNNIHYTSVGGSGNDDTVAVDNNPVAQIISGPSEICSGQTATYTAIYTLGDSLQWYKYNSFLGAYSPVSLNTIGTTFTTTIAGQYQVWATNTCSTDTSTSINLTVNPNPQTPTVTAIGSTTFCQGGGVTLTSSAANNNLWSTGANTNTVSVTQVGTNLITVTYTDNNGCKATSAADTVIVKPASVFAGNDTSLFCGNGFTINPVYNPPSPTTDSWSPATYLNDPTSSTPYCLPKDSVTYIVTAALSNGCTAKDTISISAYSPTQAICTVTVDSLSKNNIIVWDKPANAPIKSFLIYRDTANNNFALIGSVPYDSLSQFTDTLRSLYAANGDPNASTWKYKLAAKDTCGNVSAMSPYHKTLFIQNNSGNFSWNDYQIEGQIVPVPALQNYLFQRDNNSNGNWQTIQTLSASSLSYTDAAYATFQSTATWRVVTKWTINCTPTIVNPKNPLSMAATVNNSKSNHFRTSATTSVNNISLENSVNIFPNPNNGIFNLKMNQFENLKINSIEICNIMGECINRQIIKSSNQQIDLSSTPNGIYFVYIKTERGIVVKKIVVNH